MYTIVDKATEFLRQYIRITPSVVIVLGSGLSGLSDNVQVATEIPYKDIPGFCVSKIVGHENRLVYGILEGKYVLLMKGRFHYYEGFDSDELALPFRVFANLGIKNIILTNAAGGVNEDYTPGDIVLIRDHISLFAPPVLRGPNFDRFGHRFPDMSNIYTASLRNRVMLSAQAVGISLKEGTYCFYPGPNYETPSDIRALKVLGADMVGMSTVPEAMVSRHAGMNVVGISLITNKAAGFSTRPLSHRDVINTSNKAKKDLQALVRAIIKDVPKE